MFQNFTPAQQTWLCVLVLFAVCTVTVVFLMTDDFQDRRRMAHQSSMLSAVDPWALMVELMTASQQAMPKLPEINKTVLLYWSLQLEELAEQTRTLASLCIRPDSYPMHLSLEQAAKDLAFASTQMRMRLKLMDEFSLPLTPDQATALLDDITDCAVVQTGFSIAAGLPGAAGYMAVQTSNLSKKNPRTGMIDKDPGGKWIKGEAFQLPDLQAVIAAHMEYAKPHQDEPIVQYS